MGGFFFWKFRMRTPLWEKIYRSLVEDIQRGRYPVGSVLPTESEIIDTFGVSRHTARRAYAELVRLGYVRRTPHVGSQVINTGHLPNFYYEVESFSNLDPYHNLQPREILAQSHFVYAPGEEEDLPFAENEPVWRIDFARFGRQPYEVLGLTTAWMPSENERFLDTIRAEPTVPLINLLCRLRNDACQTIDQSVRAKILTSELAKTLRTRPGSPILEILRTFRNPRGEVLLCSRNYFKGNNFSLDIRLTRKPFA